MPKKSKRRRKKFSTRKFILNCSESKDTDNDWTYEDAVEAGVVTFDKEPKPAVDLRETWWRVDDQNDTGACVGFATAYGVLRWHFVKAKRLKPTKGDRPSARFIWMANKETDEITSYPTTFIETSGTQTKLALNVARKYGFVLDRDLPMTGGLSAMSRGAFYAKAAPYRIASYHNLGTDLDQWRSWLSDQGPVLTRLIVDSTWRNATDTRGHLTTYMGKDARGGHAVCLVGYTPDSFIVRNSWGTGWGDKGFAYASNAYVAEAFSEAYGAVL